MSIIPVQHAPLGQTAGGDPRQWRASPSASNQQCFCPRTDKSEHPTGAFSKYYSWILMYMSSMKWHERICMHTYHTAKVMHRHQSGSNKPLLSSKGGKTEFSCNGKSDDSFQSFFLSWHRKKEICENPRMLEPKRKIRFCLWRQWALLSCLNF